MQNDSTDPSLPEFEKITPAKIEISPQGPSDSQNSPANSDKNIHKKWLIASFSLSVALAIAVFVMLPRFITQPDVVKQENTRTVQIPPEISPWQEAQLARERQQAQQILEPLLDLQFELEEKSVRLWAQQQFSAAAALAAQGDEKYRERQFQDAAKLYSESLELMRSIADSVNAVIEQQLQDGFQSIHDGVAEQARAAFELVRIIDPDNEVAHNGLKRVATLDRVNLLVQRAKQMEQQADFDSAQKILQEALALDDESLQAKAAINAIKAKILERDFSLAMSEGYRALQQNRLIQAEKHFTRAGQLKPRSAEAHTGRTEVTNLLVQNKIARLRAEANTLIESEQWHAAQKQYQAVLALDPNLIFAQQGLKRTGDRARLDDLMQEQLADPGRLTSDAVYREAEQLLEVAGTVANPGPRLRGQIDSLMTLLKQAVEPSLVRIESDNVTDVTLYKVGHLGNFTQRELSLKPGGYVLIGKRVGYRDVRKEFVVSKKTLVGPIKIQCEEKI